MRTIECPGYPGYPPDIAPKVRQRQVRQLFWRIKPYPYVNS